MIRVLAAYAPGPGHCTTILPLVQKLAARPDCQVYLCGSQAVARFAGAHAMPVRHRQAGHESYLRTGAGLSSDEVVRRMGHRSRGDISQLIDEIHPDLVVCDTSERGAVVAASDHGVPFLRVVSCADAATVEGSAAEMRRRALIRGRLADDLTTPLNRGTVAFGPTWFFHDDSLGEQLRCFRFRPFEPKPERSQAIPNPRPRALVTFGTFITEPSSASFQQILNGLIDAGITSIAVKIRNDQTRDQIREFAETLTGKTGSQITVTEDLNLRHHLLNADVLLCHGSATSTLQALYQLVPPIIAPSHGDTFFVANRCSAHNAAVTIDWGRGFCRTVIRQAAKTALQSPTITTGITRFTADNEQLPPISSLADELAHTR